MYIANRYVFLSMLGVGASLLFAAVLGEKAPPLQELSNSHHEDQFDAIDVELKELSSPTSGQTVDCGSTTIRAPEGKVSRCANAAFEGKKPFHVAYSGPVGFFYYAYGLAGDIDGNVFEVLYDSRGLLH